MRFFRRRKTPTRVQEATNTGINKLFRIIQIRWVRFMEKIDRRYSYKQKKIGLVFFCFIGIVYCVIILISAFSPKKTGIIAIPTTTVLKQSEVLESPAPFLSSADTLAIKRFRYMIDSLNTTDSGKVELNILNQNRPGLLDSFYSLEKTIE